MLEFLKLFAVFFGAFVAATLGLGFVIGGLGVIGYWLAGDVGAFVGAVLGVFAVIAAMAAWAESR